MTDDTLHKRTNKIPTRAASTQARLHFQGRGKEFPFSTKSWHEDKMLSDKLLRSSLVYGYFVPFRLMHSPRQSKAVHFRPLNPVFIQR